VLLAAVLIDALHAALEDREIAFNRVSGHVAAHVFVVLVLDGFVLWPAPGSADTELGVLMGPEVSHGKAEVYTRVQA
jgi:hypothetical protein